MKKACLIFLSFAFLVVWAAILAPFVRADMMYIHRGYTGENVSVNYISNPPGYQVAPDNQYLLVENIYDNAASSVSVQSIDDFYSRLGRVSLNTVVVSGNTYNTIMFNTFFGTVPTSWPSQVQFNQSFWTYARGDVALISGTFDNDITSTITWNNLHKIQNQMSSATVVNRLGYSSVQKSFSTSNLNFQKGVFSNISAANSKLNTNYSQVLSLFLGGISAGAFVFAAGRVL